MKLLVFAHRLEVGGTQVNAIELAAALRDLHGFDIVFFATPGPLSDLVLEKGLRLVPAPDARLHPSMSRMRALRALVRQERPDLIQAWDWWQGLEAYCGVHLTQNVPLVVTDMMMTLTRTIPRQVPTTFGVPRLRDDAMRAGWRRTDLLLPPVDLEANGPGSVDGRRWRQKIGVGDDAILCVSVSRLSEGMKSEPLVHAIETVRRLGPERPLRLALVGDGMARERLDTLAREVNQQLGLPAVVLTGALLDPRPAYAAADIVIGMGGSALRGMAFARPVVVVGEGGFAKIFSPESAGDFHREGFYGHGGKDDALAAALATLAADPERRADLGRFGRTFVERHHGLDVVSTRLARFLELALSEAPASAAPLGDVLRTACIYLRQRGFRTASRDLIPRDRS